MSTNKAKSRGRATLKIRVYRAAEDRWYVQDKKGRLVPEDRKTIFRRITQWLMSTFSRRTERSS